MQIEDKIIAITTDNGANMVAGCKKLDNQITELVHYRCAAHILNLAVNEGLLTLKSSIKKL